jgi:hypothetical protein
MSVTLILLLFMIANGFNLFIVEWRITLVERAALGVDLAKPKLMLTVGYLASIAVYVCAAMAGALAFGR